MGISVVLEKEFARTINYSITMSNYAKPVVRQVLGPPLYLAVPKGYHRWVPISLEWLTKAVVIRIAWRLQRVFSAGASSLIGGLMCSRALLRIADDAGIQRFGLNKGEEFTVLEEALGYTLAAAGIYAQLGNGKFDPKIHFPFNLLTWPFGLAENWIQWQITKTK